MQKLGLGAALGALLLVSSERVAGQDASPSPAARSRTLPGELIRVDLTRGFVTIKSGEREKEREYDIVIDRGTRITSHGRSLALSDLRPGERAIAVFTEEPNGRRRASILKLRR